AGLFSSLFVRPSHCSYYFGDYYGADCASQGFQPWCFFRSRHCDPLFNYYTCVNHGNPAWFDGLRQICQGRFDGRLALPPRTFIQQNTIISNTTVLNNTTNVINNITNQNANLVRMVTPITQIQQVRGGHLKLTSLAASQLAVHRTTATQLRDIAWRR